MASTNPQSTSGDYRAEMDRRMQLRLGTGLKAPDPINNPATARPYQLH